MIARVAFTLAFLGAAGPAAPSLALQAPAPASAPKEPINNPSIDSWTTQGKSQKTSIAKSEGVAGGYAYRVKVTKAGANPWDVAAQAPVTGAIRKGDVLLLALWAKTEGPPSGQAESAISARVQQSKAPYGAAAEGSFKVGGAWKTYYVSGTAPVDLPPGDSNISVHLAQAKQTIDLGPVILLNLGPEYDLTKLPHND